jgi:aminopeptidase-like protein
MNDPTILGGLQQTDGARAMAVRAIGLMREIFPICRSITGNGVLAQSIRALARLIAGIDGNRRLRSRFPLCEPRLGKRGLFRGTGGKNSADFEYALLWLLNQAGSHGLNDVAVVSGLPETLVRSAADALLQAGMLEYVDCTGRDALAPRH